MKKRPTLGSKVDDQQIVVGPYSALGVGAKVGAGRLDVPLSTDKNGGSIRIELATPLAAKHRQEAFSRHALGDRQASRFENRRRDIGQTDQIVDRPIGRNLRSTDGQCHRSSKVVKIAFAMGKTRRSMIATDDDHRRIGKPARIEPIEQHADGRIVGGDLSEVIGKILSNDGYIGQERWKLALELLGIESP